MDFDKLKQWLEIAQKYQNGEFWGNVFDPNMARTFSPGTQESPSAGQEMSVARFVPNTDIYVTDSHAIILVELPGVMKEDLHLSVSGHRLAVRGQVRLNLVNAAVVRNERTYGEFERIIELPEAVDSQSMHARLENGLLIVTYTRRYRQEERVIIE
ncbi:Hsp20/alpha crystallin family protein [Ectobacillus ponti]|uniref:Hsp20/alpha crystallin family protein n=1 Tax=Ectobacillus ponti TaxID=2961894 RepID=A0AA42BN92_9BACI|nr:Hsp20/alpha crystallin family protein [Ectobacillus ponti]MCP8967226.1 Hsp20/alpha crystallin family protein [Ectobacillus ponti]